MRPKGLAVRCKGVARYAVRCHLYTRNDNGYCEHHKDQA